jgi:hypothetical protein
MSAGHSVITPEGILSIDRPRNPAPKMGHKGKHYWLVVWPDGLEQWVELNPLYLGKGRIRGALEVEIVDVRDNLVIEQTWTWNFPSLKRDGYTNSIPPRGRGWVMADDSHDKFTVYRRERDWAVVE